MITITYAQRPAALYDGQRLYLDSQIAVLEHDHPRRRFIECMCAHAIEAAAAGTGREPYSDTGAERQARDLLLPDDDFAEHEWMPDSNLAERFNVPLEQVARRRAELPTAAEWPIPGP